MSDNTPVMRLPNTPKINSSSPIVFEDLALWFSRNIQCKGN